MRHQIIIQLLVIFFISNTLVAQEHSTVSISQLNEDLDYFQKVIEKTHPITYLHIEKTELDSIFAKSRFDSTQVLSNIEMEKRVRNILSKIGCAHTSIEKPKREAKYVFPLTFYAAGKNMFITKDLDNLLDVTQPLKLLDINGNTSEDMIAKMLEYRASDGYNTTLKYQLINSSKWFSLMYSFYFDADTVKNIRFVNSHQDTLQITRKLKKITPRKTKAKKDYDSKFGKNVFIKYYNDEDIAVLKIKSFSGAPIVGTIKNNNKYKKALKEIEERKIKNLIIDLRYNTGGNAMAGYQLVSRFVNEKHRVNIQYHGGGIFKYAIFGSKVKLVLNSIVGPLFSERTPTYREGKSYINIKPQKRIYTGKVYVLVNGLTLSTASNVASFFKYKTNATLLGEETGGGENNLNAYFFPKIRLPNSKIEIRIPQYRINLGLSDKIGSGVVPDIKIDNMINYTEEDDGVLKKALQLISNDKRE